MSPKATDESSDSLRRLPGTGWQTRDGRFTIETASGTWSLVDAEQTDELGLPLVRGPFRSLTEAKAAIEAARTSEPATSTLTPREATPAEAGRGSSQRPSKGEKPAAAKKPKEADEPRWIGELDPADRRRAGRLIARLTELGVRDPEGIARRDVAGDVPTVARVAVANEVAAVLGDGDATAVKLARRVLEALAEGRDESLDVRWRLVDDSGRPIGASADDLTAARKRAKTSG